MRPSKSIAYALHEVNRRNRLSTCDPKVREGWNALLESLLLKSNCYEGYGYLKQVQVPYGELPGYKEVEAGEGFEYPDKTRVTYNVSPKLRRWYQEIEKAEKEF